MDLEEAKKAIQKLSPDGLCLGGLLDLKGVASDWVDKAVGAFLRGLFGVGPIGSLVGTGIAELVSKLLRRLQERLGIAKNETIECLRNIVNTAKEASQYIDDERLRGVVEEIAKKWGWDVDTFRRFVKTAAGKSVTEDEVREMIKEALKSIEEELEKIKRNIREELRKIEDKIGGSKIGIGIFFLNDVENGLLYGNFIVEGGVPKIKTQLGTAENEPEIDLVDTGKFHEVAEDVLSRLTRGGRVVLTGPRGIGKSTLATYVAWRSLLGGLGKVALDKSMDAVIHVDSLNPGDALELNNLIKTTSRRFIIIYDPSPIKAYYKPETMQMAKHDIESIKKTLKELMEVENAWVIIVLPKELYDEVSKDATLKSVLDEVRNYVINVDLKDKGFLSEIVKRYSGCGDVSEHLVERIMDFDSYTLIAKYVGVWLRENKCQVKDVNEALRESTGEPKLFFANYIWSTVLRGNEDLARKVSVPLILHAAFGPIPEGVTYITKAVNEGGVWGLVNINRLAGSKLEGLREGDLEPIAKWISTLHEDLIEETLKDLVGLRGEEARKQYINHGFENFINALDWDYENGVLSREVKPEKVVTNLLTLTGERLKHALKPYTNCWKRTALIIGFALDGDSIVPRLKNLSVFLPENLRKLSKSDIEFLGYALSRLGVDVDEIPSLIMNLSKYSASVVEFLGDALKECGVDVYLLVGNKIPPLIMNLTKDYAYALTEAFVDKYNEAIAEVRRVLNIIKNRSDLYNDEVLYSLGLALIIANTAGLGRPIEPSDADATLHIVSSTMQHVISFTSLSLIKPVLGALVPLRDKAPQRYLEVLASALGKVSTPDILGFMCPDLDTVMYILNEFDYILNKYRDGVKGHAWTLVDAIGASINSLYKCIKHCGDDYMFERMDASFRTKLEHIVSRVAGLLDEIDRLNHSLGIIAWAHALPPALDNKCVRALMENVLGIDVADKAKEVVGELSRLRAQELIRDEGFMGFVKSWLAEADEKVAREILEDASIFVYILAQDKLDNDELKEAEELFNGAAEWGRVIGVYKNYLDSSNWALRVEAIKGSLAGDDLVKLVNGFKQLYEEAVNAERLMPAEVSPYYDTLSKDILKDILENILSDILGGYLVSLALKGGDEEIRRIEELLKEQWQVLNHHSLAPILTRLTLNALLSPRVELSSELKGKLVVKPWELMMYLVLRDIDINSLPVLRAIYGTIKPGDEKRLCDELIDDPIMHDLCIDNVSRAYSEELDQRAEGNLRQGIINVFQRWISKGEVLDLLKKLSLDAESLNYELRGLMHELSGKSLQSVASFDYCSKDEQLRCSSAHLTYMLYALVNGNEKLAKAHALYGAMSSTGSKLLTRLFLEAYGACCDLGKDEFRRAVARLFFYHV